LPDTKLDETERSLVDLTATPTYHIRTTLAVSALMLAGLAALAPFAQQQLAKNRCLHTLVRGNDICNGLHNFDSAVLAVFGPSNSGLVLASGYLFSALIVIPHALTFPGAFSPEGFLGAGLQGGDRRRTNAPVRCHQSLP
jgi:hypothetical protein